MYNNPLAYTDPSGYFSLRKFIRTAAAVAVAYYTGYYNFGTELAPSIGAFGASAAGVAGGAAAFGNAVVSSAALGGISSGSFDGAVSGAVNGALFFATGSIGQASGFGTGSVQMVALHAAAGCFGSALADGSCSDGAVSAGVTTAVAPHAGDWGARGNLIRDMVIGGTSAKLAGGNFANGAQTAAFMYLYNELSHLQRQKLIAGGAAAGALGGYAIATGCTVSTSGVCAVGYPGMVAGGGALGGLLGGFVADAIDVFDSIIHGDYFGSEDNLIFSQGSKTKDVPDRGIPGEWVDGERRSRLFGADGRPAIDIDKPHQGYDRPHVHEWDSTNGRREHPGRDVCPWPRSCD